MLRFDEVKMTYTIPAFEKVDGEISSSSLEWNVLSKNTSQFNNPISQKILVIFELKDEFQLKNEHEFSFKFLEAGLVIKDNFEWYLLPLATTTKNYSKLLETFNIVNENFHTSEFYEINNSKYEEDISSTENFQKTKKTPNVTKQHSRKKSPKISRFNSKAYRQPSSDNSDNEKFLTVS